MARLVLTTPEGQETVTLAPRNTLGRHPSNSIQLLDKIVSKEHCVVVQQGNEYVLQDLGSLNGTFINGERVAGERALRDGDEIALGSTRAVFHLDMSRLPVPPPGQATATARQWPYSGQPSQPQPAPVPMPSLAGRTTDPDPRPVPSANQAWHQAGLPENGVSAASGPGLVRPPAGTQPMAAYVPHAAPSPLGDPLPAPAAPLRPSVPGPKETLHRTRVDLSDTGRSIG